MRIITKFKLYKEDLNDSWSKDDITVTLRQLLDETKDIPVQNIKTERLIEFTLTWDNDKEHEVKIEKADLIYPVLVILNDKNDIEYIIDGNHRVNKAIKYNLPCIKVKFIKLSDLSSDFRKVLY